MNFKNITFKKLADYGYNKIRQVAHEKIYQQDIII